MSSPRGVDPPTSVSRPQHVSLSLSRPDLPLCPQGAASPHLLPETATAQAMSARSSGCASCPVRVSLSLQSQNIHHVTYMSSLTQSAMGPVRSTSKPAALLIAAGGGGEGPEWTAYHSGRMRKVRRRCVICESVSHTSSHFPTLPHWKGGPPVRHDHAQVIHQLEPLLQGAVACAGSRRSTGGRRYISAPRRYSMTRRRRSHATRSGGW